MRRFTYNSMADGRVDRRLGDADKKHRDALDPATGTVQTVLLTYGNGRVNIARDIPQGEVGQRNR